MATHLHRDTLLDHPLRDTLHQIIQREPGVSFLSLFHRLKPLPEHALSLGYGSLSYHLHLLETHGFVTSRRSGRYRRYYENGGPQGADTSGLALLQTEPVPDVARILLDAPGLRQHEVWRRFLDRRALTRQAVAHHLQRLEAAGLVVSARAGRAKAYYATEKLPRLLAMARPIEPKTPESGIAPVVAVADA